MSSCYVHNYTHYTQLYTLLAMHTLISVATEWGGGGGGWAGYVDDGS